MKLQHDIKQTSIAVRCDCCGQHGELPLQLAKQALVIDCDCGHSITLSSSDLVDALKRISSPYGKRRSPAALPA